MDFLDDVLVVGGSVAGSATAVALVQRGLRVRVVERERFPRDKPCGEGVMPAGVAALDALGLLPALKQRGAQPLEGIAYHHANRAAVGRFPAGRAGLCVRRLVLDEVLAQRATELGVQRMEGVELKHLEREGQGWVARGGDQVFRARFLVGADGPRSWVRRRLGLTSSHGRDHRYGVRQHFRLPRPHDERLVHVHLRVGAELYVTPSGPDCLNVACLMDKRGMAQVRGDLQGGFRAFVDGIPEMRALLRDAEPVSEVRACGPLRVHASSVVADGALLVGDAAGYVDAITGEGVSMALRSAPLAAEAIARALATGDTAASALRGYARDRAALTRNHALVTELLLFVSRRRALASAMVRSLGSRPEVFSRMLAANDGAENVARVLAASAPSLLMGWAQG